MSTATPIIRSDNRDAGNSEGRIKAGNTSRGPQGRLEGVIGLDHFDHHVVRSVRVAVVQRVTVYVRAGQNRAAEFEPWVRPRSVCIG